MTPEKAKTSLSDLQKQCEVACEIARTARRNDKSLAGHNFYGNKFHDALVALARSEGEVRTIVKACNVEEEGVSQLAAYLSAIKSTTATNAQRIEALKNIRMFCQSVLLPHIEGMTANPVPQTEQVLPHSVVQGSRGYIEKVIFQANGCYEHSWYDACAVMIRRFVETLIIEAYEAHGRSAEIKDNNGDFLMLRDLLTKIFNDPAWNLQRDTKKILPEIKELGDRSAHTRRYIAKKDDIDKVLRGLRVVADDLLHLANLK